MREWRVGTFTMGFALIALGVFLLLDLFGAFNGGYWAMRLWPVVIIFLGVEVVLYAMLATKKPENLKIKYDFVSMFLVVLLGMASLGLWGFNEVLDRYAEETGRSWFQEYMGLDMPMPYYDHEVIELDMPGQVDV